MYWIYTILAHLLTALARILYLPFWLANKLGMIFVDPLLDVINKKRDYLKKERASKFEDEIIKPNLDDDIFLNNKDLNTLQKTKKTDEKYHQELENNLDEQEIAEGDSLQSEKWNNVTCTINAIKPRKWLYSDTYDPSDFSKIWDAKKLIKSMVELLTFSKTIYEETDDFEYDVKRARVASVLSAYTGMPFDESINALHEFYHGWFCDDATTDKNEVIIASIKSKIVNEYDLEYIDEGQLDPSSISCIFYAVMIYRKEIERAMNVYSGLLESNFGFSIGIKKVESIYNPILKEANKEIDDFLVLLLGETYNKTFKEVDLIRLYNYPTITDHQIMDWKCDNW